MKDQQLHPDLRRSLCETRQGWILQHPLMIVQPYRPRFNALYNRQFKDKRDEIAVAKRAKDWPKFIFLHEPTYRVHILEAMANKLSDQDYWRVLAEVWLVSDNVFQKRRAWISLWSAPREHRGQIMRSQEHEMLDRLPEYVTIHRGSPDERAVYGLSWTLDRRPAVWFANRFAMEDQPPLLATALVRKKHIKALFSQRHENDHRNDTEIVVLPQHLREVELEALPIRKTSRRAA